MKAQLLLLAVTLALAGCGSSGVAVPNLDNQTLDQSYASLKSSGFKVSVAYINASSLALARYDTVGVAQTIPPEGTPVAPGSHVTLIPRYFGAADPAVSDHLRRFRVPDFRGRSVGVAMRWANRHGIYWSTRLPPLGGSVAKHLFAAFYVTAQRPTVGARATGWLNLTLVKARR